MRLRPVPSTFAVPKILSAKEQNPPSLAQKWEANHAEIILWMQQKERAAAAESAALTASF